MYSHSIEIKTRLLTQPGELTIGCNPMAIPDFTPKDVTRFWSKVDRRTPDECWNWKTGKFSNGYGQFYLKGQGLGSHVFSYHLAKGDIGTLYVLHKCDNRACVNPNHLFLGTQMDNVQDKIQKGRAQSMNGESNPKHILTAAQVEMIRSRYASGGILQRELAAKYGVARTTIGSIIVNRNWRTSMIFETDHRLITRTWFGIVICKNIY